MCVGGVRGGGRGGEQGVHGREQGYSLRGQQGCGVCGQHDMAVQQEGVGNNVCCAQPSMIEHPPCEPCTLSSSAMYSSSQLAMSARGAAGAHKVVNEGVIKRGVGWGGGWGGCGGGARATCERTLVGTRANQGRAVDESDG